MDTSRMPSLTPPTTVMLDRERTLHFSRRAVKQIEIALSRAWGKEQTFYSAMRDFSTMLTSGDPAYLSFTTLSIVLWQGLLDDDPTLTLVYVEEAMPYMDMSALATLAAQLLVAWQAESPQLPPDATGDTTTADPLDASPGASSGPLNGSSSVSVTTSFGV